MTIFLWSQTAADNDDIDATINWQENQAPSSVNNSARAVMAAVRKYWDDMSGNLVLGGTSTAYTVTSNQVFTSLVDGIHIRARMNVANGATPTLNVDSRGAKAIQSVSGTAVATAVLLAGAIYGFTYDSTADAWIVQGAPAGVAIGTITDFGGATAPSLWLLCFGQAVSRTTYAGLFAVVSTTYGAGDGSTTFNLPDLRGRAVAGKDDMGGSSANRLTNQTGGLDGDVLGASGGTETHALTEAQLAAHTHAAGTLATSTAGAHTHNMAMNDVTVQSGGGIDVLDDEQAPQTDTFVTSSNGDHTHTMSGSTASTGSGTAHNNVQPTIILNKIIFAGV